MPLTTRRRAVSTFAAALAAVVAAPAYAHAVPAATEKDGPRTGPEPRPLRHAHAHNDYLHPRPLHDALDHGFTSVEADVFLVDGDLLVAHEATDLDPTRTLRSLYLDPLRSRVRANHGSVYRGYHRSVHLLVDIKTDGAAAYTELHRQLTGYRSMLSTYAYGAVRPGAVTPVVSGDRAARVPLEAQRVRHAFYDGRPDDLGTAAGPTLVPLVSANWTQTFGWTGVGPIPTAERAALRALVDTAHRSGQRVRFWSTPDLAGPARDAVWTELLSAGVDHLNTDDLAGLEHFLRVNRP